MTLGFLLTRAHRDTPAGVQLEYWLRSERGPLRVRITGEKPVFFVERERVTSAGTRKQLELRSLAGTPVDAVYFDTQRELLRERDRLQALGGLPLEADIRPAERYVMERFITGACEVTGELVQRDGYLEALHGTLRPAEYAPAMHSVSLDIETDGLGGALLSVALLSGEGENEYAHVLMVGEGTAPEGVTLYANETLLLRALVSELRKLDPDLILGWNVIEYDFDYLITRCAARGVRFAIGRDGSSAELTSGNSPRVRIAGRVVLDGIGCLLASSQHLESYALDDVAQLMLGRGKLIDHAKGDPVEEIRRMYREDRAALARYNLEDCRLTRDVFAHADLIGFVVQRKQLTGLPLDRVRGMVAAFDYLYLPRLHRAGLVAPSIGGGDIEATSSPGGYVLESRPGLYDNVLVLDFKSLYPSIIRTFCIDPLGLAVASDDAVPGFEGASFDRQRHILPSLITTLWSARDDAKRRKDGARSQAIKILMNSFYGVLGTTGCRFFNPQLVSSITRRGHEIITRTRDLIEARGQQVIYGDTDSLFVWLGASHSEAECRALGQTLASELNVFWQHELATTYRLQSQLEIQFDTHYLRFFMPTLRDSERGSKKRYAGMVRDGAGREQVIFKGLEAVRTDWTPLARRFQRELYRRIFVGEDYERYIVELRRALFAGELDAELIYRKRLRRPLDAYVKNVPPHVRAARMLEQQERHISYYMTVNGPEPVKARRSTLDYPHYLERQLAPAADAILQQVNTTLMELASQQLSLF